ncbi:hypothetical protein MHYP_G00257940 [Metynnis hypsauchen]
MSVGHMSNNWVRSTKKEVKERKPVRGTEEVYRETKRVLERVFKRQRWIDRKKEIKTCKADRTTYLLQAQCHSWLLPPLHVTLCFDSPCALVCNSARYPCHLCTHLSLVKPR